MNESETRAEYIDPKLKESGWGEVEGSKILREFRITDGRIQGGGQRSKPEIADYILVYKNQKIGVVEAKQLELPATEGVAQAKAYAEKLQIEYTYSTNGREIYEMNMRTGKEWYPERFPTPDELWSAAFGDQNDWKTKFAEVIDESGYGRIEKLSFDPYNESGTLQNTVEKYKERTGHYPERVLVDQIYRTRANRNYCKDKGIRISGPKLGRPSKDSEHDRVIEYKDNVDRIEVERSFSLSKRCYGMDLIKTKLEETTMSAIALSVLATNLFKIMLRKFLRLLYQWINRGYFEILIAK